jgi:hypothetical protein
MVGRTRAPRAVPGWFRQWLPSASAAACGKAAPVSAIVSAATATAPMATIVVAVHGTGATKATVTAVCGTEALGSAAATTAMEVAHVARQQRHTQRRRWCAALQRRRPRLDSSGTVRGPTAPGGCRDATRLQLLVGALRWTVPTFWVRAKVGRRRRGGVIDGGLLGRSSASPWWRHWLRLREVAHVVTFLKAMSGNSGRKDSLRRWLLPQGFLLFHFFLSFILSLSLSKRGGFSWWQ